MLESINHRIRTLFDARSGLRSTFIWILILSLPCYCVGGILLGLTSQLRPLFNTPTPRQTQIAQAVTITVGATIQPSITPFMVRPSPTFIPLQPTPTALVMGSGTIFPVVGTPGFAVTPITSTIGDTVGTGAGGVFDARTGCSNVDGSVLSSVRTSAVGGTIPGGSLYCRALNNNNEIGVPAVINRGVLLAIEVFGFGGDGSPIKQLNNSIEICLQGSGHFMFLDAAMSPRSAQELFGQPNNGFTCASIPNVGTVVLTSQ